MSDQTTKRTNDEVYATFMIDHFSILNNLNGSSWMVPEQSIFHASPFRIASVCTHDRRHSSANVTRHLPGRHMSQMPTYGGGGHVEKTTSTHIVPCMQVSVSSTIWENSFALLNPTWISNYSTIRNSALNAQIQYNVNASHSALSISLQLYHPSH